MNESRSRLHRYRPVALLMLVLHLTGCYGWRTTTVRPGELIAVEQPSAVRVTLTDGTQRTLPDPTIRNDSISGVALADVSTFEVRRFSIRRTLVVLVPVVLALWPLLIAHRVPRVVGARAIRGSIPGFASSWKAS